VLESLIIITVCFICTWMFTVIVLVAINAIGEPLIFANRPNIITFAGVSPSAHFHISTYIGWFSALNVSCNGYVYGARSTEYRRQMFRVLACRKNDTKLFVTRTLPANTETKM